jgi:hypothetical protein
VRARVLRPRKAIKSSPGIGVNEGFLKEAGSTVIIRMWVLHLVEGFLGTHSVLHVHVV